MTYNFFKLIHLISVIIFLGNIFTGLFWMHIAVKTNDLKIISHTIRGINNSDKFFTVPAVIVITIGGFSTAIHGHIPILQTGWILWSLILFSVSGIAFGWKISPLQNLIYKLTLNQENSDNFNWTFFKKTYRQWEIWGLIALLTPVAALIMMTLKYPH